MTVTQPAGEANIRELQLQLPSRLVARGSTLQKACLAASFESGLPPGSCQSTARVGTVTVKTPVLPTPLTGTAWLVSHGSAQFPDLDLVLKGDNLEVVLVGHTHIARSSITTSTFESLPDVPITSVSVDLPTGPNSALAPNGRLCGSKLLAPTTIIAQNGAKLTPHTKLAVSGCPAAAAVPQAQRDPSDRAHLGASVRTREHQPPGHGGDAQARARRRRHDRRRAPRWPAGQGRQARSRQLHAAGHPRSVVKFAVRWTPGAAWPTPVPSRRPAPALASASR